LCAGNVVGLGDTSFEEYVTLLFWIGGEVDQEQVEEGGQDDGLVGIPNEDERGRVVLEMRSTMVWQIWPCN
jgi:hypothetical protein